MESLTNENGTESELSLFQQIQQQTRQSLKRLEIQLQTPSLSIRVNIPPPQPPLHTSDTRTVSADEGQTLAAIPEACLDCDQGSGTLVELVIFQLSASGWYIAPFMKNRRLRLNGYKLRQGKPIFRRH